MADMPWAPASRTPAPTANRWLDDGATGGGGGGANRVLYWDGQQVHEADVYWWDGQAVHEPELVAYWDGQQVHAVQ